MLDACIALLPHNEKTARAKVPGFERQSILGHKVKGVAVVMPEPRTQGIVALLAEPGQVHQAQDVGALERRPVETPPLRVEDVVGRGTNAKLCVGGICVGGDGGLCVGGICVGGVGGICVGDGGVSVGVGVGLARWWWWRSAGAPSGRRPDAACKELRAARRVGVLRGVRRRRVQLFTASTGQGVQRMLPDLGNIGHRPPLPADRISRNDFPPC